MDAVTRVPELPAERKAAIRFLVESALTSVAAERRSLTPRSRVDWVERICEAVMSDSETSHHAVISALIATGVTTEEVFQTYVPDAARRIGEMWVRDEATFVEVSVGAGRLQALFRNIPTGKTVRPLDRTIPLGQSILMVLPRDEDHTLGAFVAADQFRRHGIWVRMAIRLRREDLLAVVQEEPFAMIGLSLATKKAVESTAELVKYLRSNLQQCPPIVVGGRLSRLSKAAVKRSGADFAVRSVREAIERCGLATVNEPLSPDVKI